MAEAHRDDLKLEKLDVRAVYSDEGSVNGAELDTYKVELVDNLVKNVRLVQAEPEALEGIFVELPSLLKAFALTLGQPGSTKIERDVMYFIHKYREDLSRRFKESMLNIPEDDLPQREADQVDAEAISSRVREWLVGLDHSDPAETSQPHEALSAFVLPDHDDVSLPDKRGYREVVFGAPAYKTLVARLKRRAKLTQLAETDAMMSIRRRILRELPYEWHISRRSESERYTMTLRVAWNPQSFFQDQYQESGAAAELVPRVITLTGSADDAQALPCSDYLCQTWPTTGPHVLNAVKRSVETEERVSTNLPDGSEINVVCSARPERQLQVLATGTADFLAEIGEIVAWLAAAMQLSPSEDTLAYCTPRIGRSSKFAGDGTFHCTIELDMTISQKLRDNPGNCWHGMFRNPVVVRGFPIPRRPRARTDLEIPLDMAAHLADARRLHDFMGRFYLKGFSAMLAVVEVVGDVVLWHLHYSPAGRRISYLEADGNPQVGTVNANILKASRHVIGWCSHASYLAGDSSANYDIRSSRLPMQGREFALEKVSFSVGQIVTGGCQFSIGKKDAPVHISKQSYVAKLQWIEQRHIVMWDEEDKCGWLVKGTSALLHLLRASLEHCRKDKFSAEFLFDAKDFREPHLRFRNDSAIEALVSTHNRSLRLYKLDEKSFDETVEWPSGKKETVTKTRTSYMTVEDRVLDLFESLEKLIDHESQGEAEAKGVNMKPRLRNKLHGWDFRDVATNRDPLYLRVATLPSSGRAWTDFAKSIRAVTLFGRGYGQLLLPSRVVPRAEQLLWQTVPTGTGFLTACTADLRDVVDNEGDRTTEPLTLSLGVAWHNPLQHDPFTMGTGFDPETWSPVQELLPTSFSLRAIFSRKSGTFDIDSCQHGAAIFGRSKSPIFTWPDIPDVKLEYSTTSGLAESTEGQARPANAISSGSTSSDGISRQQTVCLDAQDTSMTSPIGGVGRSGSGQSSTLLGSGAAGDSGSSSQLSAEEDSNRGSLTPFATLWPTKKRAASQMSGEETEKRAIAKKLKSVSLSSGLLRGVRGRFSFGELGYTTCCQR
ncbi:hypothetical protein QBC34DRAFT_327770 [Podospora aff. communis PSN243]|uniref:Uncharacterized protein n=1 Tax=Podospora aff. communis PSN243 TaxID=3040156 RepID=A0AAV9GIT3_9PEZI|nr:hypothetical protein QBC34DRAFT_327770 [Podospora aff. communis PSN243]